MLLEKCFFPRIRLWSYFDCWNPRMNKRHVVAYYEVLEAGGTANICRTSPLIIDRLVGMQSVTATSVPVTTTYLLFHLPSTLNLLTKIPVCCFVQILLYSHFKARLCTRASNYGHERCRLLELVILKSLASLQHGNHILLLDLASLGEAEFREPSSVSL